MATGKIKFFDSDKGFGFIKRDDGKDDLFVHIRNCVYGVTDLTVGARVHFDERPDRRNSGKLEAFDVSLA